MHRYMLLSVALLPVMLQAVALAGEADIVAAEASASGSGSYRFTVTVRHEDAGWDHYADRWEVLDGEGTVLGVRELLHPHDNEQPFTRELSGVEVPEGVTEVTIRARDSEHGYGGREMSVRLPTRPDG